MIVDKTIPIKNIYYMLTYAFKELRFNNYEQIAGEDFENIYDSDKDALSRFVEEATGELHKQGITVSMDITVASDTANWSSCYDREVLGKTVDYLVLMAYDEHGRLSKTAGSVASINWVENGVKNLIAQVPPEKVILGVPLYMRLWEESSIGRVTASTLSMAQADELKKAKKAKSIWLPNEGQYYFSYRENGKTYHVWQEEAKSLQLKAALVRKTAPAEHRCAIRANAASLIPSF